MSKVDRCVTVIRSMTDEERRELLLWFEDETCPRCAALIPDEEAFEDHDCPFPPICVCGHELDDHDENSEEGRCLAKDEDGKECGCEAWEEDEEEDEEEGEQDEEDEGTSPA